MVLLIETPVSSDAWPWVKIDRGSTPGVPAEIDETPFPEAPYRLYDTIRAQRIGGPRMRSPWSALEALRRYTRNRPSADPVIIDNAGRPVSAGTLLARSLVAEADRTTAPK